MKLKVALVLALFHLSLPTFASGHSDRLEDEMEMFKQESVDHTITTSTQTPQKSSLAPSVISVLTAQELKALGVTSLHQAFNYIPGVVVTETYFGYSAVNFRGLLQTHYNNKALMLINGHPMRETVNGSFHLEMVPINVIERIEVIRGPGSSLYGTNALAGVINIITKSAHNEEGSATKISAMGGSYSTVGGDLFFSRTSESRKTVIAFSGLDTKGYPFEVEADELAQSGTIDYDNDLYNFFVEHKKGSVTLMGGYFRQNKAKFGIIPRLQHSGPTQYEGYFADAHWSRQLDDKLTLSTRLRYDELERNSLARNLPTDVEMINRGYQAGAEVGLAWKRDDSLQVLTGLNYEFSHADPYLFEEVATGNPTASSPWRDSHSVSDYSLFAQALYNHDTPHQWTFGGRFNHNEDSKGVFSPRVGYVWAVNPTTTFKALYAQAFRNPDFFEKQVNTPGVLIGDDKLEHEKVQSLDLALELIPEDSNLKHVANVFYLVASDIISRAATATPGEFQYKNGSDNHFWGLEYSLKTGMVNHRSWFLSYSYKEGHDDTNDVALKYLAKHSGSAGLTWQVGSQLAASPNMIYVGRREDVGDFALFNLTLSYAINKDWSASLIGHNLAGKEYQHPEYIRGNLDGIPGGPGVSGYLKITGSL